MVSAASGRVSEDNFVVCSPQFVLAFSVCADLSHRSPSFIMTARVSLCYQSFEQDPKQSAWTEFCDVRDMDWSPITRDSHCMESLCAFIADKKYVLQDRFYHEGHLEFYVEESFLPPHLVPAQSQDVFHVTVAGTSEQFWLAFTSQGMDEEPETPPKKGKGKLFLMDSNGGLREASLQEGTEALQQLTTMHLLAGMAESSSSSVGPVRPARRSALKKK